MDRKKIRLFFMAILILLPANLLSAPALEETKVVQKQDTGLIDLDVKDVDIKELARIFSRISGLNVIVSDDVSAIVTFKGTNVEWESALKMILKTYNLTYAREGKFLRILTYSRLRQEEEGVPLITKVVFLNFAKADDMINALDAIKSGRGKINQDEKTNGLIITDTPDTIEKILEIIKDLDKRTPQVMIEAMIVSVKLTDEDQLGINWTIANKNVSGRSFTQTLTAGRTEGVIRYGKTLLTHWTLTALIDFWCQNKKAEILANPKILTLDSLPAKIELTEEIPYKLAQVDPSAGGTTTTYSFREAGIKLNVTPHISINGIVSLDLKTEQSYRTGTVDGQPTIDKRTAETNLSVADGETIVIGGLKKRERTLTIDKIPLIGNLPFLGKLFQKRVDSSTETELLIFVTPYIVTESQLTPEERKSLEKIKPPEERNRALNLFEKVPFPLRAPSGVNAAK